MSQRVETAMESSVPSCPAVCMCEEADLTVATPSTATRLAWCAERIDDDTGTRTSDGGRVTAEHCNTRAEFGATKGDHVLAEYMLAAI